MSDIHFKPQVLLEAFQNSRVWNGQMTLGCFPYIPDTAIDCKSASDRHICTSCYRQSHPSCGTPPTGPTFISAPLLSTPFNLLGSFFSIKEHQLIFHFSTSGVLQWNRDITYARVSISNQCCLNFNSWRTHCYICTWGCSILFVHCPCALSSLVLKTALSYNFCCYHYISFAQ